MAVVIGRSPVVGKPVGVHARAEHCTVTVCHSTDARPRRRGPPGGHRGRRRGASRPRDGRHAQARRGGDRRRDQRGRRQDRRRRRLRIAPSAVASAITPVPGGVGPLTNALLLTHLMRAAQRQDMRRRSSRRMGPASTDRKPGRAAKPPSRSPPRGDDAVRNGLDLEIARSVTPRPILDVARGARPARRRDRAVRAPQGQDHARRRSRGSRPSGRAASTSSSPRSRPTPLGEGKTHDDGRARAGPQPDRAARPRCASASRASGRSSGSRAARRAAATARSSRWRTSTST